MRIVHDIGPNLCEDERALGLFQCRKISSGPDRQVHAVSSFSPTIRPRCRDVGIADHCCRRHRGFHVASSRRFGLELYSAVHFRQGCCHILGCIAQADTASSFVLIVTPDSEFSSVSFLDMSPNRIVIAAHVLWSAETCTWVPESWTGLPHPTTVRPPIQKGRIDT